MRNATSDDAEAGFLKAAQTRKAAELTHRFERLRFPATIAGLFVLLVILAFASFAIGRYPVPPLQVVKIILSDVVPIDRDWPDTMEAVVTQIRAPRILAAIIVGGVLAVAGAGYQTVFKNPIVSPDILGVTAGAGFGAALGLILHLPAVLVQLFAFCFALVAVFLALLASRLFSRGSIVVMILSGMVIAALFSALISLLKFLADPLDTLPAITYWLMGGLSKASTSDLAIAAVPIALSLAAIHALRSQIHILVLDVDEATSLGVSVRLVRIALILASTLMTAVVVSFSGIIGWIGLIVPHLARMLVGANFGRLLPVSFLAGAGILLIVDNLARTLSAVEIPVGVITALVGTPFFFFLLARMKRVWD